MLLSAGICLATGGAAGHPAAAAATTAIGGPICPDWGCGANHNQVLL